MLRYPGSKKRLADRIVSMIHCERYCEPFAGGAAVALRFAQINRQAFITLIDIDPVVCEFWREILDHGENLARHVETAKIDTDVYRRAKDRTGFSPAFDLLVETRCSFSGRRGGPIGGWDQSGEWKIDARWNAPKLAAEIRQAKSDLGGRTRVLQGDFTLADDRDFCYCDPPYIVAGDLLYDKSFSARCHKRLSEWLLSRKSGWLLSYDDHPIVRAMYRDNAEIFPVEITGANPSGGGRRQTELIIGCFDVFFPRIVV